MRPVPHSSRVNQNQRGNMKSKDFKNLQSYRWLNPASVAYHFGKDNTSSKINNPKLLQTSPAWMVLMKIMQEFTTKLQVSAGSKIFSSGAKVSGARIVCLISNMNFWAFFHQKLTYQNCTKPLSPKPSAIIIHGLRFLLQYQSPCL